MLSLANYYLFVILMVRYGARSRTSTYMIVITALFYSQGEADGAVRARARDLIPPTHLSLQKKHKLFYLYVYSSRGIVSEKLPPSFYFSYVSIKYSNKGSQ